MRRCCHRSLPSMDDGASEATGKGAVNRSEGRLCAHTHSCGPHAVRSALAGSGQADQGAKGAPVQQGARQSAQRHVGEPERRAGAGARARGALENVCAKQNLLHVLRAWGLCSLSPDQLWVCALWNQPLFCTHALPPSAHSRRAGACICVA